MRHYDRDRIRGFERGGVGDSTLRPAWAQGTITPAMPPTVNSEDILRPATSPAKPSCGEPSGYRPHSEESHRLLHLTLSAEPLSISVARGAVRRWLAAWSWPADQLDDIVLAVNEAVSNATEHAYLDQPSGMVEVRGRIEATRGGQRRVTVIVRDHGRWRLPPIDDENRRRGIPLMQACMDTVAIGQPNDNRVGTRVVLRSKAVPPLVEEDC